jgi:hypothetical protein
MKYLLSITLFFILSHGFSQESKKEEIVFTYLNSSYVSGGVKIRIKANNKKRKAKVVVLRNVSFEVVRDTYKITYDEYLKLKIAVYQIKEEDLLINVRNYLDSGFITISYLSEDGIQISHWLDSLSQEEDLNTPWKDFLIAVNLILEFSHLKFKDLE